MRPDVADVLLAMGFTRTDFRAVNHGDGVEIVPVAGGQALPSEAAINAFDMSPAAVKAREDAKEPLLADLKAQADAGIAAIDAYLLIADSATNVQVRAEVKASAQRQKKIIAALKRLIQRTWRNGNGG